MACALLASPALSRAMPTAHVPTIFDQHRRLLRSRRSQSRTAHGNAADWLDADMADDFLHRVDFMRLMPGRALILGDGSGALHATFAKSQIDIQSVALGSFDEEQPWPIQGFDYIFAIRTLSTLNDLPGALLHSRMGLKDGGILFAQILGAGTLATLRSIMLAADGERPSARIHPQIDTQAASALLARAGFSKQVVDSRTIKVRFSSFERMIADMRDQALTGILTDCPPPLTKAALARAHRQFDALRDEDGKVTETFEVLALTAWR